MLSFKLVFDRETGKPKGYGFCEYKDQETALSAMRNLNGYEIGGRSLRVDNACTEKSRMEMQALMQGPQVIFKWFYSRLTKTALLLLFHVSCFCALKNISIYL